MKKWIISIAVVLSLCLLLSGLCYVELGSWNVIRTGLALSNVMMGSGVYQIADHPEKVWLSHDAEDFQEYLAAEGYALVTEDQMGARIPVEKDGVRDYVYWSVNGMYHKWTWETAGEPAKAPQTQPGASVQLFYPETVIRTAYFYPEAAEDVTVALPAGELTFSYPACDGGWRFTAQPDGTLSAGSRTFYSLRWESREKNGWPMETGFCVAGQETAAFLEESLAKLGLNPREIQDFLLCWLPRMEGSAFNRISFHRDTTGPDITPAPDTAIRIFMLWQPLDAPVDILPQTLTPTQRTGSTIVQWGGGRIE